MGEPGCLRDSHFNNLETSGNSVLNNISVQNTSTLGTRKFVTFAGSLANTTDVEHTPNDCLVELGTLDVKTANTNIVAPTKIFIHKAVVLITTKAGVAFKGNLHLSATSGTATNSAVTGTEIVGAGVTAFSETTSADSGVSEIDIDFDVTAGNYHVFAPNSTAPIANKYLYACSTTGGVVDITAGRFTVELEYSVL